MLKAIIYTYIWLIFLLIAIMAFTLPLDGWIDYEWYNTCLTQGYLENSEPAFGIICSFTSYFPDNVAIIIPRIMSLLLLMFSVLFFIKKFDIYTGLFVLYANGFQALGAYRQGTATILLTLSLYFLLKKNYRIFNTTSILSFLFHFSSLLPVLAIWLRKYMTLWIALSLCFGILLIEIVLTSTFAAYILPEIVINRYLNLANESLPGSSYFALGKVWYVIYYFYFIFISYQFFVINKNVTRFIEMRRLFYAFLPILVAVPALTLMDSWSATRVSSLTNAFEVLFFALCATNLQRLFIFIAYFIRTSIASLSFFIF